MPVSDLAAAADTTKTPVDEAHRLLYMAESRWWSRAGASPQEASMGLEYAATGPSERCRGRTGEGALREGRFAPGDRREGTVRLAIENAADYPMTVELRLAGEGLAFPDGEQISRGAAAGPHGADLQVESAKSGPQQKMDELRGGHQRGGRAQLTLTVPAAVMSSCPG